MEWDKGEGGIRRELCFGQEGEEGRSGQNKERKELTAMQEEEVRPPRDGTGERANECRGRSHVGHGSFDLIKR